MLCFMNQIALYISILKAKQSRFNLIDRFKKHIKNIYTFFKYILYIIDKKNYVFYA